MPVSTIVCLGDSITGACDLAHFVKWPQVLDLLCEAACGPGQVVVRNAGIAGQTAGEMRERLERDVLAARPAIVVLLAGGNDAGRDVPRADTAAALTEICRRSVDAGARVLGLQYHLVVHPTQPDAAWRHLPRNNDLLADAVRGVRGEIVDTAAAIAAMTTMRPEELTGPDAVHLSAGGELVYARTVFAALRRLGWLPSTA